MKILFPVLFLLIPYFGLTQRIDSIEVRTTYLGMYVSSGAASFGFLQWESDIGKAILRVEFLTNFDDNRIHLKMAYKCFEYKKLRIYAGLPPFYYSSKEKGYHTPLNLEVQYNRKWLLNFDIKYHARPNISLQARIKF